MRRGEEGATLVEMLAAVIIVGIIAGVLTEALIVGLKSTEQTERTVSASLDRQRVSRYFGQDVQSADDVKVGTVSCGAPAPDPKVSFQWVDGEDTKVASYIVDGSQRRLLRRFCVNTQLAAENTVAAFLAADDPVTVTASDPPAAPDPCPGQPELVTMLVKDQAGGQFTLEGRRRSCSAT